MNAALDRHFVRGSLFALAGLLIWFAHFSAVYAINSLACARGFWSVSIWGVGVVPFTIVAVTVPALAATALFLRAALRRYRRSAPGDDSSVRFLNYMAATVAALSLVAIVWDALPVFLIEPCA